MPKVFLQFRLLTNTWHDASYGMNDSPSATTAIIAVKLVNCNLYFHILQLTTLNIIPNIDVVLAHLQVRLATRRFMVGS